MTKQHQLTSAHHSDQHCSIAYRSCQHCSTALVIVKRLKRQWLTESHIFCLCSCRHYQLFMQFRSCSSVVNPAIFIHSFHANVLTFVGHLVSSLKLNVSNCSPSGRTPLSRCITGTVWSIVWWMRFSVDEMSPTFCICSAQCANFFCCSVSELYTDCAAKSTCQSHCNIKVY